MPAPKPELQALAEISEPALTFSAKQSLHEPLDGGPGQMNSSIQRSSSAECATAYGPGHPYLHEGGQALRYGSLLCRTPEGCQAVSRPLPAVRVP
jgi:hypothetical protein